MSANRNINLVGFLQAWANDQVPFHVLEAGAEIMEMDRFTPEKRVHQIVQKCVILWMESAAGKGALNK